MSLIKNWKNQNLLSLSVELSYYNIHSHFCVESDSLLYDFSQEIHTAIQKHNQSQLNVYLSSSWSHRLSKAWQMNISGGYNIIRYGVSAIASTDLFCIPDQSLTTNIFDYSFSFYKKKGLLRVNSGLTFANINNKFESNRIVLLPNATIELALSSTNSISASYSCSYENDDDTFIHGAVVDDYRQYTFFKGYHDILHRKDKLRLSMNYFDILNDFTFIMNAGYTFSSNPYIADYQNYGHGVRADLLRGERSNRSQYSYFNIKKGFRFPLMLTFKSTATNSLFQTCYQHIISDNRNSSIDGTFVLTSKFRSMFNIEVGYKINLQQNKIGINNQVINYAEHEIYIKPVALKKEKFELNVPLSFVIDHSGQDEFHNFDLGMSAMFNLNRWTFSLEGRNILHTRTYQRLRIESKDDYNEVITEKKIPGYIIAGIKFML